MRRLLIIALSLLTFVGQSATWYVRPCVYSSYKVAFPNGPDPLPGIYGSQDGTSYANAWNGFPSIVWGPTGVTNGDTLYICGSHIYYMSNSTSFAAQATVNALASGFTVRMDYPGDPGLIFGGAVDCVPADLVWLGPDANGVYWRTNSFGSGYNQPFFISGTNITRLNTQAGVTWSGNLGGWFYSGGTNFVKTPTGAAPSTNIAFSQFGWTLNLGKYSNIVFQACTFFSSSKSISSGLTWDTPTYATFTGANHLYFTNCTLLQGSQVQLLPGNDYCIFDGCEIGYGQYGVYGFYASQTRGPDTIMVNSCYIHDCDTTNYPDTDGHGVGARDSSNWTVTHNRVEKTGAAIDFFCDSGATMSNNLVAWNSVTSTRAYHPDGTASTGGHGIAFEGSPTFGLNWSNRIIGNVLWNIGVDATLNSQGEAIGAAHRDWMDVCNNTISNCVIGIAFATATPYPVNGRVENNIIMAPSYRYCQIIGYDTPTNFLTDYNLFYPAANLNTMYYINPVVAHDTHSVFANPKFVSATPSSALDFRLLSTSPAIGAGTAVGVTSDYLGFAYHTPPAIGAFEGGIAWYVDGAASGANNGTSWTDAWTSPTNVSSGSIAPGDTIYISTGHYGSTTNFLTLKPTVSGTSTSPITFKVSQEVGHSGTVSIDGYWSISVNWWIWDGAKDDNYHTNITATSKVSNITNNIGIVMLPNNSSCWQVNNSASLQGLQWKWVDASTTNAPNIHGFNINPSGTVDISGLRWSYCFIHDTGEDGIHAVSGNTNRLVDDGIVDHCYIYHTGDDGIEWEIGGLTATNNIIAHSLKLRGHQDGIQALWSHIHICNNLFSDWPNSCCRLAHSNVGREDHWGDIWICGNRFENTGVYTTLEDNMVIITSDFGFEPGGGCCWQTNTLSDLYWTNVVVANNTFVNARNGGLNFTCQGSGGQYYVTNNHVSLSLVVNNIFLNCTNGPVSLKGSNDPPFFFYTLSDLPFNYNVVAGVSPSLLNIGYLGSNYANASVLNLGTGFTGNSSNTPTFFNAANFDFRLASYDTVAKDNGTNLSTLDSALGLGLGADAFGTVRTVPWDIGAFDAGTSNTNLILWLTFQDSDSFSNSIITDYSGWTNNVYRYGRPGSVWPTNFPVQVGANTDRLGTAISGNTNGILAGDFLWNTNSDYGLLKDGSYGAVSNTTVGGISMFTNMNQMTVCLWAHYSSAKRVNPAADYSWDGNATLVSAGTPPGTKGAWDFGRYNTALWINNTRFQIVTNSNLTLPTTGDKTATSFGNSGKIIFNFPDNGFNNNGDSGAWHFYAFTFSNGVCSTYYEGTNLCTVSVADTVTNLTVGWNNYLTAVNAFIGIGVSTHGGDASLQTGETGGTDYPNNGWFNGQMDDLRIYNSALSASDISSVYSGGNPGAGAGGGLVPTGRTGRVTNLRVGKAYVR